MEHLEHDSWDTASATLCEAWVAARSLKALFGAYSVYVRFSNSPLIAAARVECNHNDNYLRQMDRRTASSGC